jgi:hypothetical protein
MNISSAFLERLAKYEYEKFEAVSHKPVETQFQVLQELLQTAKNTEFGRKYSFASIKTVEEFRKAVPLVTYENIAPLWHRAFDGDRDVTWPGHIKYFALSSGTTAGNKLLPVSREAIKSNKKGGRLLLSFLIRRAGVNVILDGKFFYLGGSTTLRRRGKSFYGDASGIMGKHIPFYVRSRYLPQPDIARISDWEDKISEILKKYLECNVTVLAACPSWATLLFKQMVEKASEKGTSRLVSDLWPKFRCFISYGMAFEPYRPAFEKYIGNTITYIDTYSSSEGGLTAIQEEPGGPFRLIVNNGIFWEFVPVDKTSEEQPPRLHIGEVTPGVEYEVIVNSNGGIWGYRLGDVIRFESIIPPRIVFAGRTQISLNAFGEHVTLEMLENAIAEACKRTKTTVIDYTVVPMYPEDKGSKPGHKWLVEFDGPQPDLSLFINIVDSHIRNINEDYDTHRKNNYGMNPPVIVPVARGTFYTWMKKIGKLGGQHKVPRVVNKQKADEIIEISSSLKSAP